MKNTPLAKNAPLVTPLAKNAPLAGPLAQDAPLAGLHRSEVPRASQENAMFRKSLNVSDKGSPQLAKSAPLVTPLAKSAPLVTPLNRILLLSTCLIAAYQVVAGIDGLENMPIIAYTVAFGILLVAGLLLIILGYSMLDSPVVVVVATIIPLSLSLGLVWEHLESMRIPYLIFSMVGLIAIGISRTLRMPGRLPTIVVTLVHGIAGMVVFLLPSILAAQGTTRPGFGLVGLGGAFVGLQGLLLSFLKTGRPIVSRDIILRILPSIYLLMTIAFVTGFALA